MADHPLPGQRGNQHPEKWVIANGSLGFNTTVATSELARPYLSAISAIGIISAGFSNGSLLIAANQSSFSNQNGVSFGVINSTITASVASQSAIKGLGASNVGNTAGNTGLSTGVDWVFAGTNQITISESTVGGGPNTIWISGNTAAPSPVNFSAGTTSNNLGSVVFSNSNAVSFGLNGSTITASVSTYSTVGTATTVKAVASANSVGTITRWAAEDHAHAGIAAIGISTGNTLGTSGSVVGTYWIAGSNAITVSQITSNNGSNTLVVMDAPPASYFERVPLYNTQSMTVSGSTSYVCPFDLPEALSVSYLRVPVSFSAVSTSWSSTTANTAYSASLLSTIYAVVYSRGVGASSQSLQSVFSTTQGMSQQWSLTANANATQYTVSYNITYPLTGSQTNLSTNVAVSNASIQISSNSISDFNGLRFLDIPMATSFSPGNYWLALGMSSTTSTQGVNAFTSAMVKFSWAVVSQQNSSIGLLGTASNSSLMVRPGLGSFTTNAIGNTASIPIANISSTASHGIVPMQLIRIT